MKKIWPYLSAFSLALAGSTGALTYALGGGAEVIWALGVAIGCGLVGQLFLLGLGLRNDEGYEAALRRTARDAADFHYEIHRKAEGFQAQLDALRETGEVQSGSIVKSLNDLQNNYARLQSMLEERVANMAVAPAYASAPPPMDHRQHGVAADYSDVCQAEPSADTIRGQINFVDRITIALEPVVNIITRRTAHYRMHLGMQFGGEELSNERLLHYAESMGKRSMLDMLAAREAMGLLARLRQRDADLCLFMMIGAESLSDSAIITQLLDLRQAAGSLAQGLIFELPHAMLADLSGSALESLATLARDGAFFALSQASVMGLDLKSMNILNVRYVGLEAKAIEAAGPSATLVGFAQMARLSHINVIVTDVHDVASVDSLQSITRLACGPCFAAPRRVKRNRSALANFDLAA